MTVIDADHEHRCDLDGGRPGAADRHRGDARSAIVRFISSPWRAALVAVAAVLAVDAGGTDDGAGVCVFRRCTGGYCPGCGLTRSARHLTRGEITEAWHDHPFMVLFTAQAALAALLYATFAELRSRLASLRTLVVLAALNGVLLLGIWVVRLADGSIPRFF